MSPLQQLRAEGFRVTSSGGKLVVEPRSALTDATRQTIRASKAEILAEIERDAPLDLRPGFQAALRLGKLVTCWRCENFQPRSGAYPDGHCGRLDAPAWRHVPFQCAEYAARA